MFIDEDVELHIPKDSRNAKIYTVIISMMTIMKYSYSKSLLVVDGSKQAISLTPVNALTFHPWREIQASSRYQLLKPKQISVKGFKPHFTSSDDQEEHLHQRYRMNIAPIKCSRKV